MDILDNPVHIMSLASVILLFLLNSHRALCMSLDDEETDDMYSTAAVAEENLCAPAPQNASVPCVALHHFRLWQTSALLDDDLGFWVKPRSTTWFSRFLVHEYDDSRWVQMFHMTKRSIFSLAHLLSPTVQKKDTRYRLAIPVLVRVACTLFKLSYGASLLICSELFAVGRSTVSMILRDVVHVVNEVLRAEISWPSGADVLKVEAGFKAVCGLPGVLGAIDGTHFAIAKPKFGSTDYYYFKSGGFTMNCQAVVDSSRRFLHVFVGMSGCTNDSRMLRRSTLFMRAQQRQLWDVGHSFQGFAPYLLGDAGYPVLPWLMVPHRQQWRTSISDELFNRRLSKGRVAVENAFARLKLTFKELQQKSDLHITFFPDVVICCALLHNVLLKECHEEVEALLEFLRAEASGNNALDLSRDAQEGGATVPADDGDTEAVQKRRELGVYLSLQRIVPS